MVRPCKSIARSSNMPIARLTIVTMVLICLVAIQSYAETIDRYDESQTGWTPLCMMPVVAEQDKDSYSGVSRALGNLFSGYRNTLSKVRGPVCNFTPSCSRFSQEAIQKYGFAKGLLMTTDRLQRCSCCIDPTCYPRGKKRDNNRSVFYDPVIDHCSWH